MNFDLTRDDYKQFIKDLRNRAKDPNRNSHGLPVLPPPPPDRNPADADYIDIQLSAGGSASVTVRIRRHDLFLIGYRDQNGYWFEFSRDDGRPLIPGSSFLGYGENYKDMGRLDNLRTVGYQQLSTAINQLARTRVDEENKRGHALRLLGVMICEAARFNQLLNIFAESVRRSDGQTAFEGWMATLIHGWGDLSYRLLREDAHATSFRLPDDQTAGWRSGLTTALGIISAADAVECLGLLLGHYLPPGYINRRLLSTFNFGETKGQPLVEVFSVRVDNIDGENPGDLYGDITVTDGLGCFYLYNRARSNYESICPDDIISLTGPYRSISLCQFFTMSLNLSDKDVDPSPDDEVSKGSFSWDIFNLFTNNYYQKPLCKTVKGEYGSASVYYIMFDEAVQAKVDVVLIRGDDDPAAVYGSLVARYNNYDYSLHEQKKYYQTRLFDVPSKNSIKIRPGGRIPLSRYMVAVPTTSSLVIEADLWDYDYVSPNDEIAKGVAIFPPETDGMSDREIKGQYGSIRVNVTWSALSGGS